MLLPWQPVDWNDPDGGIIRLYPVIPTVVYPRELRPRDDWDAVALLLTSEELEAWADEEKLERSTKGAATALAIEGGGDLARMLEGMQMAPMVSAGRFPDPEPRRLVNLAQKSGLPIYFVEPDVNDEEWLEWMHECAQEAAKLRRMVGHLFARRMFAKTLKIANREVGSPPQVSESQGLELCSALATAWWRRSESMINHELIQQRNARLCRRLRGALADVQEGDENRVLMVPVFQDWLSAILAMLNTNPEPQAVAAIAEG